MKNKTYRKDLVFIKVVIGFLGILAVGISVFFYLSHNVKVDQVEKKQEFIGLEYFDEDYGQNNDYVQTDFVDLEKKELTSLVPASYRISDPFSYDQYPEYFILEKKNAFYLYDLHLAKIIPIDIFDRKDGEEVKIYPSISAKDQFYIHIQNYTKKSSRAYFLDASTHTVTPFEHSFLPDPDPEPFYYHYDCILYDSVYTRFFVMPCRGNYSRTFPLLSYDIESGDVQTILEDVAFEDVDSMSYINGFFVYQSSEETQIYNQNKFYAANVHAMQIEFQETDSDYYSKIFRIIFSSAIESSPFLGNDGSIYYQGDDTNEIHRVQNGFSNQELIIDVEELNSPFTIIALTESEVARIDELVKIEQQRLEKEEHEFIQSFTHGKQLIRKVEEVQETTRIIYEADGNAVFMYDFGTDQHEKLIEMDEQTSFVGSVDPEASSIVYTTAVHMSDANDDDIQEESPLQIFTIDSRVNVALDPLPKDRTFGGVALWNEKSTSAIYSLRSSEPNVHFPDPSTTEFYELDIQKRSSRFLARATDFTLSEEIDSIQVRPIYFSPDEQYVYFSGHGHGDPSIYGIWKYHRETGDIKTLFDKKISTVYEYPELIGYDQGNDRFIIFESGERVPVVTLALLLIDGQSGEIDEKLMYQSYMYNSPMLIDGHLLLQVEGDDFFVYDDLFESYDRINTDLGEVQIRNIQGNDSIVLEENTLKKFGILSVLNIETGTIQHYERFEGIENTNILKVIQQ